MVNESRDDVAKHIGRDIEQELHHQAPSFTENCPANFLDHIRPADNQRKTVLRKIVQCSKNTFQKPNEWGMTRCAPALPGAEHLHTGYPDDRYP